MSTYRSLLRKTRRIPRRAIFEIGGHVGTDTVELADSYPVPVVSFEPNPAAIIQWRANVGAIPTARLVEAAASTVDGAITFRPFDAARYNNIGASSLYEIDFSQRKDSDPDKDHGPVQNEITVPSIRLETFINAEGIVPDVLCLDAQEAELEIVKSMGDYLRQVDTIVTEAAWRPTYKGGCSYRELASYLRAFGLRHIYNTKTKRIPPNALMFGRGYQAFDAVFVR